ncbi:MAG TPA: hypothetical protein VKF38_14540 [Anaerolineaceae bacterium]|nr:hypothetical protein [Anaerolineaceae bacterium]
MDISQPANHKVIPYLSHRNPAAPLLAAFDSKPNPYLSLGSHPDIIERVWKQIGSAMPSDCRFIVCGTPALVQTDNGILFAFALGTQYCLRLPASLIETAHLANAKTSTRWSNGKVEDIQKELGDGWIFGSWMAAEIEWCKASFTSFGKEQADKFE